MQIKKKFSIFIAVIVFGAFFSAGDVYAELKTCNEDRQLGSKCGINGADGNRINCDAPYVCSTNQYNNCGTQRCLIPVGGPCDSAIGDSGCEGGSVCDATSSRCTIKQGDFTQLGNSTLDIRNNIRTMLNIVFGFLGIAVVLFIIYGGSLWLTAAGDDDKVSKGRHTLLWAALGAIIISIAWTISSYILEVGNTIG